jgi:hypothetical protein
MNKFFKRNDDGAFDSPIAMIAFFSISLVFSSVVISWMLINAYGVSVVGMEFPNFGTNVNYDLKTTSSIPISQTGGWSQETGVGYVSSSNNEYLFFNNILPTGTGEITNTYIINNTAQSDYSIVLSYSDTWGAEEVLVSGDGFYLKSSNLLDAITDNYIEQYSYSDANKVINAKIKTVYNPNNFRSGEDYLKFYLNDNLIFVTDGSKAQGGKEGLLSGNVYWAGVGSKDSNGLTVSSFSASSDKSTQGITSLLSSIQLWVTAILTLVVWNVDPQYLPWELNLLLVKSQAFCIGLGVFFWARGTS